MKLPVIYFDREKCIKFLSENDIELNIFQQNEKFQSGIISEYSYNHNTGLIVLFQDGYKMRCNTSHIGIFLELR